MNFPKLVKAVLINYVLWFPALVISYIFWSAVWSLNVADSLYQTSDSSIFLADFIPPWVNPHFGDHFLNGATQDSVMRLWYFYVCLIIISSIPLYFFIKKFAKGLVKELDSLPKN